MHKLRALLILVFYGTISTLIILGCAMHAPTAEPTSEALKKIWSSVAPSDFDIPDVTPYDEDQHLRNEYIKGYADGIEQGIAALRRGEWHTGDVFIESESAEAYAKGWRAAGIVLLEKNMALNKITDENADETGQ